MPSKFKPVVSAKLRESAKGQSCMVRLPGICNFNPETTVLAHMNGAGMGTKSSDIHAAFCCSDCHDAIDGRVITGFGYEYLSNAFYQGMVRTQAYWLQQRLINVA